MLRNILLFAIIICAAMACKTNTDSKEIAFVCTHGAARSPIASAYFNKLAAENDLNYHSVFRATEPSKDLTKETIDGLEKDGFDIGSWKPRKVSAQDVAKAYRVVTFDCTVPLDDSSHDVVEWNGTPSISKDYNVARDLIKGKVEQLIQELKTK